MGISQKWPNLFIVGAVKAGTTSLYRSLSQHPGIYMSPTKEPDFFSEDGADERAYLELFSGADGEALLGEATPWYLAKAGSAERIRRASPDAKIIIVLREPVSRAYSHYLMDVRTGEQPLGLWEAIQSDEHLPERGYVLLGFYCEQVATYLRVFGDQVHVMFFEDVVRDPRGSLEEVLTFLGLDPRPAKTIEVGARNSYRRFRGVWGRAAWQVIEGTRIRSMARRVVSPETRARVREILFSRDKPEMDPRVAEYLQQVYRDEATCLRQLLGRGVPWGPSDPNGSRR